MEQSVPRPLGPKRITRTMPVPPKAPSAEMDPDELLKQQLLNEVVAHAKRETRAVLLAKAMESFKSRPFIVAVFALMTLAITAYSYTTRSEWVFGAPAVVSSQREGHLRFAMFLTMQRVLAYRDSMRVFPASLQDVGEAWPGVAYRVSGDTLAELTATDDRGQVMSLRSDRDAQAFVGLSSTALRRNIPGNGAGR